MFKNLSFKRKLQITIGFLSLAALSSVGFLSYELIHNTKEDKKELLEAAAKSIADKVDQLEP